MMLTQELFAGTQAQLEFVAHELRSQFGAAVVHIEPSGEQYIEHSADLGDVCHVFLKHNARTIADALSNRDEALHLARDKSVWLFPGALADKTAVVIDTPFVSGVYGMYGLI